MTPVKQTLPPLPFHDVDGREFFANLQTEVGRWSLKNFGHQGAHRPLMGVVEELCELYDALDGGINDEMSVADAIGDTVIYAADYFHNRGWELKDVWLERVRGDEDTAPTMLKLIGKLCHSHLKSEQGIRGKAEKHEAVLKETFCRVFGLLDEVATDIAHADVIALAKQTWAQVSKRDWTKNPENAHLVAEGINPSILDNPAAAVAAREIYSENAGVTDKVQVNLSYEVGDDDDGGV